MIKLLTKGTYDLFVTKGGRKVLALNGESYIWITLKKIGQVLVASQKSHLPHYILASGTYNLYKVADEPDLVDLEHLELSIGDIQWQGYLLPTGLPTPSNARNRIIPCDEVISGSRLG